MVTSLKDKTCRQSGRRSVGSTIVEMANQAISRDQNSPAHRNLSRVRGVLAHRWGRLAALGMAAPAYI